MGTWVTVMEVTAWDGSIIELNKVLEPTPDEEPYIIITGLKTGEKKISRKWGDAGSWDTALALFTNCIRSTIPEVPNG